MVEVIGQCEKVAKKATCKNCGAILRYYEKDTRVRRYTTMGSATVTSPSYARNAKKMWW